MSYELAPEPCAHVAASELDVGNTSITDNSIKHLTHLNYLVASYTKITDDGNINHHGGLCRSYMKKTILFLCGHNDTLMLPQRYL